LSKAEVSGTPIIRKEITLMEEAAIFAFGLISSTMELPSCTWEKED
jgi:hypothetical protein